MCADVMGLASVLNVHSTLQTKCTSLRLRASMALRTTFQANSCSALMASVWHNRFAVCGSFSSKAILKLLMRANMDAKRNSFMAWVEAMFRILGYACSMSIAFDVEQAIIFEDLRFIFLDKPAGLAVHGVIQDEEKGDSLGVIELLRQSRPFAPYLELAHRLDKPTSGVLVIAKRKSALRAFQKQQENRGVDKYYLALVKGKWQGGHQKVDAPLLKTTAKDGKWFVQVDKQKGKRAVSYFAPVKAHEDCSLVRVKIITGRTHQIRVHAAWIGFPVLGDDRYGDKALNQRQTCKRLMLHAESIKFSLPGIADYDIQAPYQDFNPYK